MRFLKEFDLDVCRVDNLLVVRAVMHLNGLSIFKLADQRNGHCHWPINDDLNWTHKTRTICNLENVVHDWRNTPNLNSGTHGEIVPYSDAMIIRKMEQPTYLLFI